MDSDSGSPGSPQTEKETVTIDHFRRLDLRVGTILSADPHPNADRLLVLEVNLGTEQRQLVAGIRSHYDPADLVGRQVVVVANLAPAKLRGVESQGMLLAASANESLVLITPEQQITPGAKVS